MCSFHVLTPRRCNGLAVMNLSRFTWRNPFSLTATNNSNAIVYPREKLATRMATRYPMCVRPCESRNSITASWHLRAYFRRIFARMRAANRENRLKTARAINIVNFYSYFRKYWRGPRIACTLHSKSVIKMVETFLFYASDRFKNTKVLLSPFTFASSWRESTAAILKLPRRNSRAIEMQRGR